MSIRCGLVGCKVTVASVRIMMDKVLADRAEKAERVKEAVAGAMVLLPRQHDQPRAEGGWAPLSRQSRSARSCRR